MKMRRSSKERFARVALVSDEKKSWREFGKRLLPWNLLVVFLVTVATFVMSSMHLFTGFETAHLDTLLRSHPRSVSNDIFLVEISEEDYHRPDLFNGTSPLERDKLTELIQAVEKYHPAVIGVDVDTTQWHLGCSKNAITPNALSPAHCAEQDHTLANLFRENAPVIVWAAIPKSMEPPLKLNTVIGGWRASDPPRPIVGVPRFAVDNDGIVRHYETRVEVNEQEVSCPSGASTHDSLLLSIVHHMRWFVGKVWELLTRTRAPLKKTKLYVCTFGRTVLEEYQPLLKEEVSDQKVILNFFGDRYRFPIIESKYFFRDAGTVAKNTGTPTVAQMNRSEDEASERGGALLNNKIVLIGGAYAEARDAYITPVGLMQGIELNALAIQTELDHRGIRHVTEAKLFIVDMSVGIIIVAIFYSFESRPWTALFMSFAIVIPGSLLFSWGLFNRTTAYWFNFIPVAAGMVVHQLYELAKGGAEANKKLAEMTKRFRHVA